MTRLSGTLVNRPAASSAKGARYYATDEEQIYFSTGTGWLTDNKVDEDEAAGQISGANLAVRPEANSAIGYIWTDESNGNQYEAFPNAWALIGDLTPPAAPTRATSVGGVVHNANANVARPEGYAFVIWVGSVEPENAINNDIWEEVA